MVFRRRQHGIACHLGAGAGSSRYCDARRRRHGQRLALTDDFQVVQRIAAVAKQHGDRFGGVDSAATAKSNHQVTSLVPGLLHAAPDDVQIRLAGYR